MTFKVNVDKLIHNFTFPFMAAAYKFKKVFGKGQNKFLF
jgi:hypothetical protein